MRASKSECAVEGCFRPIVNSRGWCGKHYQRWRKHGDPYRGRDHFRDPEEAFEHRTIPEPNTGCLLWVGGTQAKGYGFLRVEGKAKMAHRYAWERVNGPIPPGLHVDHMCYTPQCVEVSHLRLATRSQNQANRSGLDKNNTSGYRNVTRHPSGWVVEVKETYIGLYRTIEEAAEVAKQKRKELFGEFAGLG